MKRYEKVLICVEDVELDEAMLDYAKQAICLSDAKEVIFAKIIDEFYVSVAPAMMLHEGYVPLPTDESKELRNKRMEDCRKELAKLVKSISLEPGGSVQCKALVGIPLVQYLRLASESDCDLLVVGRHHAKTFAHGSQALLAKRLTSKATCSVLTVPQRGHGPIRNILAPIRNSTCSANALQVACEIGQTHNAQVVALNVYSQRKNDRLEQRMTLENLARQECEDLFARVETSGAVVEPLCIADDHAKPVEVILKTAIRGSADLIVIGARGRTGLAGVLLGAVTEQLIQKSQVPVLAVKEKGECLGVLQAILSLTESQETKKD